MLRMETVTEHVADYFVGHHPTMPGAGKTAQAIVATRRFENRLHSPMMTNLPCLMQDHGCGDVCGEFRRG